PAELSSLLYSAPRDRHAGEGRPSHMKLVASLRRLARWMALAASCFVIFVATDAPKLAYGAPPPHLVISAGTPQQGGTAFNFTVTALDQFNATAPGYAGTVHFTSTDPGSPALPANSTLTNGTATFSATLKTVGSRTITATDTVTASITGTSGAITVNPG